MLSTAPVFDLGRVAAGDSARDARRALRGERTLRRGRGGKVLAVRGRRVTRLVKLRAGRVQWVGAAKRGLKKRRLLKLLEARRYQLSSIRPTVTPGPMVIISPVSSGRAGAPRGCA